jgi:uncharacterized protein involved in type VI secretion and phage assembly
MDLLNLLHSASEASKVALDSKDRVPYPSLAIVVDNKDPENKRRIRVSLPSNPGLSSYWYRQLTPFKGVDLPLPDIGQTVLVLFADGDINQGYFLAFENATNPPQDKGNITDDYYEKIKGDKNLEISGDKISKISGDSKAEIEGEHTLDAQKAIALTAQTFLTIFAKQYLRLQAGASNFIELGANGDSRVGGNWVIDLNSASISFTNASSITINGKEIAVVGARTDDNQVIVDKGW